MLPLPLPKPKPKPEGNIRGKDQEKVSLVPPAHRRSPSTSGSLSWRLWAAAFAPEQLRLRGECAARAALVADSWAGRAHPFQGS